MLENTITETEGHKYMMIQFRCHEDGKVLRNKFRVSSSYYRLCVDPTSNGKGIRNKRWRQLFTETIKAFFKGKIKKFSFEDKSFQAISSMSGAKLNINLRKYDDVFTEAQVANFISTFTNVIERDINTHSGITTKVEEAVNLPTNPVDVAGDDEIDAKLRMKLAHLLRKYTDAQSTVIVSHLIFLLGGLKQLPLKEEVYLKLVNKIKRYVDGKLAVEVDAKLFEYFIEEFNHEVEENISKTLSSSNINATTLLSTWRIMQHGFIIHQQ